jgi:hypothetical protein
MNTPRFRSTLPFMLYGFRIIEDPNCVIDGPTRIVQRSWRERLFTCPWRPWVATYAVTPKIPNPDAVRLDHINALLMHPQTAREFRKWMRENNYD